MPPVERKFRSDRRFWIGATVGLFGMVAFFVFATTSIYPTTPRSPTHASIVGVALLLIAITLPFAILFLYIVVRDSRPRPRRLELSGSGFSISDEGSGVRTYGYQEPGLRLVFMENLGNVWGQPVVVLLRPRFPTTFLPREAFTAICHAAARAGLSVKGEPAGPQLVRWTVTAATHFIAG
jgi:hypothetical protein